jgi:hypothetical protein
MEFMIKREIKMICPFMSRTVYVEGYSRQETIEMMMECKQEKCMAWKEERTFEAMETFPKQIIPGHCKLIDK